MNTPETPIDLAADLSACRELLDEANTRIAVLTQERDAALAQLQGASPEALAVVTAERDKLAVENATLKSQAVDFNKKLAAHLCRFGIRHDAVEQKAEGGSLTLTEQCLARQISNPKP